MYFYGIVKWKLNYFLIYVKYIFVLFFVYSDEFDVIELSKGDEMIINLI